MVQRSRRLLQPVPGFMDKRSAAVSGAVRKQMARSEGMNTSFPREDSRRASRAAPFNPIILAAGSRKARIRSRRLKDPGIWSNPHSRTAMGKKRAAMFPRKTAGGDKSRSGSRRRKRGRRRGGSSRG